jgi:hypothetical protein
MTTTEVQDLLDAQRRLIAQHHEASESMQSVFHYINEMSDEETRAIVDSRFVDEMLEASEHLREAGDELMRGVRDA